MKKEINIPTNCPSCDSILLRVKDQLFCKNTKCASKLSKQVENFAKVMRIKGLGPKTVESLELENITDIYELTVEYMTDYIGEKTAVKLINEIEKSKSCNLGTFLAACSITLIGNTAGNKVAALTSDPLKINTKLCKEAGLGEKATTYLVDWIEDVYKSSLINLPLSFEVTQVKNIPEASMSVCITGKVVGHTKTTITQYLEQYGIKVTSGINKNTSYLICDDQKGSLKEKKANELNITIVKFEEFKEILKQ